MPRALAAILVLGLCASAVGQDVDGEVARLRALASETDEPAQAREQLLLALEIAPGSPEVLGDLLRTAGADVDERGVRALLLARRACDAKGRVKVPTGLDAASKAALKEQAETAKARVKTLAGIAAIAKKLKAPGDAPLARQLRHLARLLAAENPTLEQAHLAAMDAAVERCAPRPDDIIARLRGAVAAALRSGKSDEAFLGARALRGMGVQQRRAQGAVEATPLESEALAVLEKVRATRWSKGTEPLTVDDLRGVPNNERRAWGTAHSSWRSPALVVSAEGRYRVESVCGLRSTLMVAVDVEAVHRRLAAWIGVDPFEDRVGTIRLVASDADMEGEGQSLLWARAFNAGEVTISPVNITSRRWLIRGFSHELTHRFDGDLYGVLPSWLREGRANYAQVTSMWSGAPALDARAVDFPMLQRALQSGYTDATRLRNLLAGRPARPSDDYDVGYALWLFMTRRHVKPFAGRVEAYLKDHSENPGVDPLRRFELFLADGESGRPDGPSAFAAEFATFLHEAAGNTAWKQTWMKENAAAERDATARRSSARTAPELSSASDQDIFDTSNYAPHRKRTANPAFGETHAFTAAEFFEAVGDDDGASDAYAWARSVDEPTLATLARTAEFHSRTGSAAAAWAMRLAMRRLGSGAEAGKPAANVQRAVAPVLDRLASAAHAAERAKQMRTEALLRAEHDALANALGLPASVTDCGALPAVGLVAAGLDGAAWAPANATAPGVWSAEGPWDLVLGSRPPAASQAPAFVLSNLRVVGAYALRTRVRRLSEQTSCSIVLGHTRSDRGLTVELAGGAAGGLSVTISDGRDADWGVCTPSATATPASATEFDLALDVVGSAVRVQIDGKDVLSFRTATGLPLEDRVGFLVARGAVEFQRPRIERLPGVRHFELSPTGPLPAPESWNGRRLAGIERDPAGMVLLVVGGQTEQPKTLLDRAGQIIGTAGDHERVHVSLPAGADATAWSKATGGRVHVRSTASPIDAEKGPLQPWWLAVDDRGVVRSHGRWTARDSELHRLRALLHRTRGW